MRIGRYPKNGLQIYLRDGQFFVHDFDAQPAKGIILGALEGFDQLTRHF